MTDPVFLPHAGPAPERRLFARLWRTYLRHQTGLLVLAFALMAVEGATLGALATMLEPLFDRVFAPGNDSGFLWIAWAVLGLFVLRAVVLVLGRVVLTTAQQRVSVAMQGDLLRHVLTLDGAFFRDNAPGALIERVQGDALAVQGIWTSVLAGVGRDVVGLVVLLIVALRIDPIWTLATLVGAPLLIVPAALGQRYIRRKSEQLRQQAGLRATRLDEIFHGIQAVKLNRMEDYQAGRFRRIADTIVRAEVRQAFGRIMMPALVDIVTGIGFFVVLVLAGSQIAAGERTTGEFMSFFAAITLTFTPIRRLAEQAGIWQVAKASLARIFDLFDRQPQTRRPLASLALPPPGPPDLRFDGVRFAHGTQPVLHDVSFVAEAGKMTALVGASGAGKTTLFQLLTGLIEPDGGEILVGGAALSAMTLADQRALFAYVTQDVALFDETVEENVLLGQTGISRDRLDEALAAAHVSDFLDLLPEGRATRVGPRGSALSGGQRQRVAIARALVREAPVLLLDEATSALDSASEQAVTEALGALSSDRTVLVIAHRLSTVRDAAKIVVLAAGRVVEQGSHEELLALGGTYAGLHKLQLRE